MRRIIGTIGATLAVAGVLGVGIVLTAQALPMVAAASAADRGITPTVTSIMSEFVPWAQAHDKFVSGRDGGANFGLADGSVRFVTSSASILPYIEQENLYRQLGSVNSIMGDGSVRFIRDSSIDLT